MKRGHLRYPLRCRCPAALQLGNRNRGTGLAGTLFPLVRHIVTEQLPSASRGALVPNLGGWCATLIKWLPARRRRENRAEASARRRMANSVPRAYSVLIESERKL